MIGPGMSAKQPATARPTRGPQPPSATPAPQPIAEVGPHAHEAAETISAIPAWLAAASRIRDQLAAADHRSDQQRTEAWTGDRRVLALLAEASDRLSPWDAAREVFGGNQ